MSLNILLSPSVSKYRCISTISENGRINTRIQHWECGWLWQFDTVSISIREMHSQKIRFLCFLWRPKVTTRASIEHIYIYIYMYVYTLYMNIIILIHMVYVLEIHNDMKAVCSMLMLCMYIIPISPRYLYVFGILLLLHGAVSPQARGQNRWTPFRGQIVESAGMLWSLEAGWWTSKKQNWRHLFFFLKGFQMGAFKWD